MLVLQMTRSELWIQIQVSGACFDPGFRVGFFRIPDPQSPTHISESLVTIFWVKIPGTYLIGKKISWFQFHGFGNMGLGSEIRDLEKPIPDPGSMCQKGTGFRMRFRDTAGTVLTVFLMYWFIGVLVVLV
jgi:hypothetical protein